MNANVDYLGLLNLIRGLLNAEMISKTEAKKIAARLKVEMGANVVHFL